MARLFTISGAEILLEPNRAYVLGRGRDCDIVVEDVASSRQHARLLVGRTAQIVFVEDLHSRNGTFVNEQKIHERTQLVDSCGIRIGATVYLLSFTETSVADDMVDTGTKPMENLSLGMDVGEEIVRVVKSKAGTDSDFAGKLDSFSMVEILQILHQSERSGTLHLALEAGHGSVEVRDGEVLHARHAGNIGIDALTSLAQHKSGLFWLVESSLPVERTVELPTQRLLLEVCWAMDG